MTVVEALLGFTVAPGLLQSKEHITLLLKVVYFIKIVEDQYTFLKYICTALFIKA